MCEDSKSLNRFARATSVAGVDNIHENNYKQNMKNSATRLFEIIIQVDMPLPLLQIFQQPQYLAHFWQWQRDDQTYTVWLKGCMVSSYPVFTYKCIWHPLIILSDFLKHNRGHRICELQQEQTWRTLEEWQQVIPISLARQLKATYPPWN